MRARALMAVSLVTSSMNASRKLNVALSQGSSRINGVELRPGPKVGVLRFFSLRAAEKALGVRYSALFSLYFAGGVVLARFFL